MTLVPLPLPDILRLAEAERIAGRLKSAAALLDRALAAAPDDPDAQQGRAVVAFQQGRLDQAAALARAAVTVVPDRPAWWRNLCTISERRGDLTTAQAAAERALALAPDDPDLWHALALVQYRRRAPEAAAASARAALRHDPHHAGAHVALAESLLLCGDFAAGWDEYEWRYRLPDAAVPAPPFPCPAWNGAALPGGRLLLVADQGYGDAIQFARYLPWARARCAAVALVAAPELAPLLAQRLDPGATLAGWAAAAAQPEAFAAWAPLSGLPRLHGTRLETIPGGVPYLTAPPARVAAWAARLDALAPRPARRVGVVWAGRETHPNDANRSAPPAALAPLAAVPGIALVSMQPGPAAAGRAAIGPGVPDLGGALDDFAEAAAALAALDLLITVDFGAGASGRGAGPAGLDAAAVRAGLALVARSGGQPLVSHRPAVPPGPTPRLGRAGRDGGGGAAALARWLSGTGGRAGGALAAVPGRAVQASGTQQPRKRA